MPVIGVVKGDLLQAKERYIAQQCNCMTVKSHGLSAQIASRYPYGDHYKTRQPIHYGRNSASAESRDIPGTIKVLISPLDGQISSAVDQTSNQVSADPRIICMFAQWVPGKSGAFNQYYPGDYDDTPRNRQEWFLQCLKVMDEDPGINSPVAMPYTIGCGLAGGNWDVYQKMIVECKTEVVLYRL